MTDETLEIAVPRCCPFLGLEADKETRAQFVHGAHRCWKTQPASTISLQHQQVFCLSEAYQRCSRFQAQPSGAQDARRSMAGPTLLAVAAIGLAIAAGVMLSAAYVGNPFTAEPEPATSPVSAGTGSIVPAQEAGTPTASASASAAERPTPATPDQLPTATIVPMAAPSVTPVQRTTAAPTAFPYVVEQGDSLTSLAARFAITVEALADANRLSTRAGLLIGQSLVIPPAR